MLEVTPAGPPIRVRAEAGEVVDVHRRGPRAAAPSGMGPAGFLPVVPA
ncbi:hypothetical protein [Actinomadura roseirufa]|nr:hypothetical protein [Actinomadura roseirufa]